MSTEFEIINPYYNLIQELKRSYYLWSFIRKISVLKIQKWWKNIYLIYLNKKLLLKYIQLIKRRNLSIIGKFLFQSNM